MESYDVSKFRYHFNPQADQSVEIWIAPVWCLSWTYKICCVSILLSDSYKIPIVFRITAKIILSVSELCVTI